MKNSNPENYCYIEEPQTGRERGQLPKGFATWLPNAKPHLIPYPGDLLLENKAETKVARTEHLPPTVRQKPVLQQKSLVPATPKKKPTSSQELLSAGSESARLRTAGREPKQQIGQILLKYKLITQAQLEEALSVQAARKEHKLLGEILIELGFLTEIQLISTISKICQIPFIPLEKYSINMEALEAIPFATARRLQLIPLDRLGKMLQIAMANPFDYTAIREIEELTSFMVKRVVVTRSALNDTYVRLASEWEGIGLSKGASESMETIEETAHGEEALAEDDAEDVISKPAHPSGMQTAADTQEFPAIAVEKEEKEEKVGATWVDEISMLDDDELEGELIDLQPKTGMYADSTKRTTKVVPEEKLEEIASEEAVLQEKETKPIPRMPEADAPVTMAQTPPPEAEPAPVDAILDDKEIPLPQPAADAAAEAEETPEPIEKLLAPVETEKSAATTEEPEILPAATEDYEEEEEIETILAEVELESYMPRDPLPVIDLSEPFPDRIATPAPDRIGISTLDIEESEFARPDGPSLLEEVESPIPVSAEEALALLMATGEEKPQELIALPARPEPPRAATPISPEQWEILVPKSANQEFHDRIAAFYRRRVMHAVPVTDEEFETIVEIL